MATGDCPDEACPYLHGIACPICDLMHLHPYNPDSHDDEVEKCAARAAQEHEVRPWEEGLCVGFICGLTSLVASLNWPRRRARTLNAASVWRRFWKRNYLRTDGKQASPSFHPQSSLLLLPSPFFLSNVAALSRFGILPGCNHPFCVPCLRGWRSTYDQGKIVRACPICRTVSYFVVPSQ